MTNPYRTTLLGFDPGRDKCGLAVMGADGQVYAHQVVPAGEAIAQVQQLCGAFSVTQIVMGNQTTSADWQPRLETALPDMPVALVDERYTSLEARDRYWDLYPPAGLLKLIPRSLRPIRCPIDDIVAILLIERYLNTGGSGPSSALELDREGGREPRSEANG
ncbi:MAG: pre-16S rRNA-processing nuclease YqgF [Synechococcales bacterium]|nr:pre-16S rRNA-processing nuclease YqgF [Synechococcales bacterium]